MPAKIFKFKYGLNFTDMHMTEIDDNSESNGFTINEPIAAIKNETTTQSSISVETISNNTINNSDIYQAKRKRDHLIEKHGRDKIRFHGNSTILLDSDKYKMLRKLNNEASKRSKKKREAREKLENFFIMTYLRNLIENKKKLNQEIHNLKIENEKLQTTNTFLKILLKAS